MPGVLVQGFPTRALSLTVAAAILAAALVVIPTSGVVPPIGGTDERADAHTQTSCSYEYQGQVQRRVRVNGEWATQWVPRYVRVCRSVAHTHWWQTAASWAGTHLACAGVSASAGAAAYYSTRYPGYATTTTSTIQRVCTNLINRIGSD